MEQKPENASFYLHKSSLTWTGQKLTYSMSDCSLIILTFVNLLQSFQVSFDENCCARGSWNIISPYCVDI